MPELGAFARMRRWSNRKRLFGGMAFVFFMLAMAGEAVVRWVGLSDYPLYIANGDLGYVPAPSQRGSFMGHDWAFNSLSMGVEEEFKPDESGGIILVGDSIVFGGNPYPQDKKVGPLLEDITKRDVWPVSAGSWALFNELSYLDTHAEVRNYEGDFVFIINSGDLSSASIWRSENTHPRTHPTSELLRLVSKHASSKFVKQAEAAGYLNIRYEELNSYWSRISKAINGRIFVLIYPSKYEYYNDAMYVDFVRRVNEILSGHNVKIVDIKSRWKPEFYRDDIHPTFPDGTAALAAIIADILKTR